MRHRVVVLLAALAIVPAGCGGDQRASSTARTPSSGTAPAQYAAALNRAQDGLTARFERLQEGVSATSTPTQDRRTLLAYERAVSSTVDELRRVTPPPGLGPLHERLIAQVAGYGTAIGGVRRRLATGDARAALAAPQRLAAAIARVERRISGTIQAINRKLEG